MLRFIAPLILGLLLWSCDLAQAQTFTPVASSTFTGADESPMVDGAGNWTSVTGVESFDRTGNVAAVHQPLNDEKKVRTAESFNACQYSRANLTVTGTGGGSRGIGLSVLQQTAAVTGYSLHIDHAASNNAAIDREVANVFANLVRWTQSFTDADLFTIAVCNEIIYVYDHAGTLVKQQSDVGGGVATTGKPGISFSASETSASLDNWEGGNFSPTSGGLIGPLMLMGVGQ